MVLGLGIDIIEIDRIRQSIENYGERFLNKVFTPEEIRYCNSKFNKFQHYAARFAAKEAVYKALTSGWKSGLRWKDIEIQNDSAGMPSINTSGKLKSFLSEDAQLRISISHSESYVTSVAIIFKDNSSSTPAR
ncbi:MAG: holo-ACP synthase [Ignavibacteriota bacterium]|nr:MAG: holo-[acyl-carrier-protein] synthase [Chlorobiota bacterium]MBE7477995.1 holo-ACP synthase [Ignavibacteriales bacterium]MBL1123474.1 holo-[acyl-carrier-protein] synthase [Ignavibacteriota bacterium]MBV6421746.1 Holo-[acyl-carrier-protein] synthase [Ignavibacteriaceae bacterium]MCE7857453.1 holo-[acyl-carrier-protein] synthase [Ignavibacteria bacterium CHB3]MEB2296177.1 holo-ACP synthase [Ignavibacteria bacterium]